MKAAEVNFLERHCWSHLAPIGNGTICPTTLPDTRVRTSYPVSRTRCFESPW